MDSTRLLDSRWALVAGTALSMAALAAGSTYWATRRFKAGAASTSESLTDKSTEAKEKEEDAEKRFSVQSEFYNVLSGTWEKRDEDDADKSQLFTVKHRSWPKSADFTGHEDYTAIEFHSQPLIELLRSVLKEVETAFDEEPSIDSQDLYLHLDQLKDLMKTKQEQKARLEEAGPEKSAAEKDDQVDAQEQNSATTLTPETKDEPETKITDELKDDLPIKLAPPQTLEAVEIEVDHFNVLLTYIEELFAPIQSKLERLLAEGSISFGLLWAVFPPNSHVVITDEISGERQAFKLKSSSYHMSRDGLVFELSGTKVLWNGTRFARTWINTQVLRFKGLRRLAALPAHPLGEKERAELTARGKTYCSLAGVRFLNYSGVLIQVIGAGMDRRIVKLRAEGRAVIDTKSYRRMNPSRQQNMWDDAGDDFQQEDDASPGISGEVPHEDLCLLPPTMHGFSLVCRDWGELLIHLFTPISFSSDAWNHLELSPDYKDLIRSLVQQNSTITRARHLEKEGQSVPAAKKDEVQKQEVATTAQDGSEVISDVISGKGGGLVIVLHGRPGVGKTLTAEAVSELLEAPLYSVTAGELGVQAEQLEKRLRDTLDVSEAWGAVLLIDECDVFLQERQPGDVARNAMVSVFLRMLEYHSGVLFMTTNGLRACDPAFLSRFSVGLTYPDLSKEKRKNIWTSFLKLAGVGIQQKAIEGGSQANGAVEYRSYVSAKYLDQLASKTGFNGRTIKNIVRTSQALAMSKNLPLTSAELDVVIKTTETFHSDFKEADENGVYDAAGEGWKDRSNIFN